MILSKNISVKNSKYYKDLGYKDDNDYIIVNVNDLPKHSRIKVKVSCDYCDKKKEISYKDYNNNIKKGNKYACSIKCGSMKAKETNLEKLGVESHFQLEEVKEKIKEINLEKWGVEHISQNEYISKIKSEKMKKKSNEVSERMKKYYLELSNIDKENINKKREETNLEKWGEKNISKVDRIKKKVKKSFEDKWGGYTFNSEELVKKVKKTNIEKWGFEYPSKNELVNKKRIKTNLEKWGFVNPMMNESVKNNLRNTLLSKYNEINIMFSEEFRKRFKITNEKGYIRYLGNKYYEFTCDDCNKIYEIDYDNFYKRNLRNVKTCTHCFPILENRSIMEKDVFNFIKSFYDGEIIESYRDGLEIDIYLTHLKLGFEFNGLYWHSEEWKDKWYHLNKTNHFKERGIRIIHIWEDDWSFRKNIVKSQIKNLLNKSDFKLGSRNFDIKIINDSKIVREFLEKNHIQGFIRSSIKIGLFNNDELISLMTFDNLEGRKKMEDGGWNLSRFCSKLDHNIIGSASKLLKFFIKNYKPKRIISFADKDWSQGDLYYKLGFNLVNDLKPDYKYIIEGKRINKQRFTKNKLVKLGYDSNLTSTQIINEMGILKIYNVGQLKFQLEL
jgi:hypothetical protein